MVNIRQMLAPSSMYYCKCPYLMTPQGITVHNTANDASANNEVSYMIGNTNEVSYHYAVDDVEIVQALPLNRNAWHAGDGGSGFGNRNTIGIEICYSRSGGSRFDKAEENAADLIAYLLKKYGWGIERVKRHYDYDLTGKYCPHRTMDKGWQRFLNMVVARLNGTTTNNTTTNNQKENGVNRSMYVFSKNWYLKAYSDVAQSKTYKDDPYAHYEKYGKKEGRKPLPPIPAEFCEGDYLELNPDVAEAVKKGVYVSGIHHYLMYGFNEKRKINKTETEESLKKRIKNLEKELKEEKERIKKVKDAVNE